MRILVVSDVSGYMRGGVPTETSELLRGLVARGHTVGFVGDVPLGGPGVRHFPLSLPTRSRLVPEVRRAVEESAPEVVHLIAMGAPAVGRLIGLLRDRNWVLTVHSVPPHERKIDLFHGSERAHYACRWLRFLPNVLAWRRLLSAAGIPKLVVHSEAVRDVVARYGYAARDVCVIPLGCRAQVRADPTVGAPSGEGPVVTCVAGIAHTKGQHDLVTAFRAFVEGHPRAHLHLVGETRDAGYAAFVDQRIAALGLRGRVSRREGVDEAAKQLLLQGTDLYVQPSHEEGFCLAFIEAASAVVRLVGTDTGAIRSIVGRDPSMAVVPVRSPAAMAEAMDRLMRAPVPADAVAMRARRLAADFSWSVHLDAHEALYAAP